jgi:hypothetical protein
MESVPPMLSRSAGMPELPDAHDFEAERDELRGRLESREEAPESPESPGPSMPLPTPSWTRRRPQSARIAKLGGAGGVGCLAVSRVQCSLPREDVC